MQATLTDGPAARLKPPGGARPRAQRSFSSAAAASRTMPEDKDARPECDQPGAHLVLPEELKLRCTLEASATLQRAIDQSAQSAAKPCWSAKTVTFSERTHAK